MTLTQCPTSQLVNWNDLVHTPFAKSMIAVKVTISARCLHFTRELKTLKASATAYGATCTMKS